MLHFYVSIKLANSVDPDQTPHSAASDLGLHCLLRTVCPIRVNMVFTLYYNYANFQALGGFSVFMSPGTDLTDNARFGSRSVLD